MDATITPLLDTTQGIMKTEASNQVSPPPAYSSQPRLSLPRVPAGQTQFYPKIAQQPVQIERSVLAALISGAEDEDTGPEGDAEDTQSPIILRINTSIRISDNNNVVCFNDHPAEQAKAIARAVIVVLQENSSGQCGIPMVDEDGRPRPVRIEVDAAVDVGGTGNIVGNEKIVMNAMAQRVCRRQRDDSEDDDESPAKRRRS